ncbi:hypothetical protein GCM10028793_22440 [Nocardiopsis oceani]
MRRAAETATIKRQETGNHPHPTTNPHPRNPPPAPKGAHPKGPNGKEAQHPLSPGTERNTAPGKSQVQTSA